MARSPYPPPRRRFSRRQRLVRRAAPTLLVLAFLVGVIGHALITGGGGNGTSGQKPAAASSHTGSGAPKATTTPSTSAAPAGLTPQEKTTLSGDIEKYLRHRDLHAAVGVLDLRTGESYCYHCHEQFVTASIVKLDILETLLYQAQQDGTHLSAGERELATQMIENSDNDAASDLYVDDDDNDGIDDANHAFGLTHTDVASGGVWGDTLTTVTDQLILLRGVVSADSKLSPASRRYVRTLMSNVEADQRWGVPAAAAKGEHYLVKNGWLPRTDEGTTPWSINSDGILLGRHGLDPVAVSVLTKRGPSEDYGIATVEHLAKLVVAPLRPAASGG